MIFQLANPPTFLSDTPKYFASILFAFFTQVAGAMFATQIHYELLILCKRKIVESLNAL